MCPVLVSFEDLIFPILSMSKPSSSASNDMSPFFKFCSRPHRLSSQQRHSQQHLVGLLLTCSESSFSMLSSHSHRPSDARCSSATVDAVTAKIESAFMVTSVPQLPKQTHPLCVPPTQARMVILTPDVMSATVAALQKDGKVM